MEWNWVDNKASEKRQIVTLDAEIFLVPSPSFHEAYLYYSLYFNLEKQFYFFSN